MKKPLGRSRHRRQENIKLTPRNIMEGDASSGLK